MNRKLHFISGLPRSGSTLLSAILRQNPRFHAAMSSPVNALFSAALGTMSSNSEFTVFFPEAKRREILKGLFATYLAAMPQKTMELIYKFIGEEPFAHDFTDVTYDEPGFDDWIGLAGLHRISGRVEFRKRNTILPPDLFRDFDKLSFWNDNASSRANVIKFIQDDLK